MHPIRTIATFRSLPVRPDRRALARCRFYTNDNSNNNNNNNNGDGSGSGGMRGVTEMLRRFKPMTMQSALKQPTKSDDKLDPRNPYGRDVTVTEIKLRRSKQQLALTINTGEQCVLSSEFLRVESPSAEVQGHGSGGEKKLVYGKKYVKITTVEAVGNYALRVVFDDKHDTGIYSWQYLYRLASQKYTLQKLYILALREHNRSRYPKRRLAVTDTSHHVHNIQSIHTTKKE